MPAMQCSRDSSSRRWWCRSPLLSSPLSLVCWLLVVACLCAPSFDVLFVSVSALKNGAPTACCSPGSASLNPAPGHGGTWQTSPSPVTMAAKVAGVATTAYTPGVPVTIVLTGTISFMGFMTSAFKVSDTAGTTRYGSWNAVTGLAKLLCSGQAATQTGTTPRTSVTLTWNPPATAGVGTISLRASVIKSLTVYWLVPELLLTENAAAPGGGAGSTGGGGGPTAASSTGTAGPPLPPPPAPGQPPLNPVSISAYAASLSGSAGAPTTLSLRVLPPPYQTGIRVLYVEFANTTARPTVWRFATNITVPASAPPDAYTTSYGPLAANVAWSFRVRSSSSVGTGFGTLASAPNVTYITARASDPMPSPPPAPAVTTDASAASPTLSIDLSDIVPAAPSSQVLSVEVRYRSSNASNGDLWTATLLYLPLASTLTVSSGLSVGSAYDVAARLNTLRGTTAWSVANSAVIAAYSPCPNGCSGQGICAQPENVCLCNSGYLAADCSVPSRIGWSGKGPVGEQCFQGFCIDFGQSRYDRSGSNDTLMYFKLTVPTLGWAGVLMDAPDGMTGGTGYYLIRNAAVAATDTIPAQPSSTVASTIYSPILDAPNTLPDEQQDALLLSSVTSALTANGQGTIFYFAKRMYVAPAPLFASGKQNYAWAFGRSNDIVLHLDSDRGRLKIDWYLGEISVVGPPNLPRVYASMIAFTLGTLIVGGLLAHSAWLQYSALGHAWLQRRVGRWKGDCGLFGTLTLSLVSTLQDLLWGELSLLALYVLCHALMIVVGQQEWTSANKDGSFVWGHAAALHFGFVMLPVAKNNIWAAWFGSSFERLIKWHRICGRLALAYTYIHMATMIQLRGSQVIRSTNANWLGFWSMILFTLVMASGWEPLRRYYWRVFIAIHVCCAPIGYVFACLHTPYAVWFSLPPAILFGVDWIVRLFARPLVLHRAKSEIQVVESANAVVAAAVSAAAAQGVRLAPMHGSGSGRVAKLILDVTGFPRNIEPCSYCFICIPAVSAAQWHPFSINNFPPAPKYASAPTRLEFLALAVGSWTDTLYSMLQTGRGAKGDMIVLVDGPYGRLQVDPCRFRTLVLVAGGIGVTPMLSMLDYLLQQLEGGDPAFVGLRCVHLCWTARSQDCFHSWPGDLFQRLHQSKWAGLFQLRLHCTGVHGSASAARKSVAPQMQLNPAAYAPASEVPMMSFRGTGAAVANVPPPPPPLPPAMPAPMQAGGADTARSSPPTIPRRPGARLAPLHESGASGPPALSPPLSPSLQQSPESDALPLSSSPLGSAQSSPVSTARVWPRFEDGASGSAVASATVLSHASPHRGLSEFVSVQSGRMHLDQILFGVLQDALTHVCLTDLPANHVARLSGVKSRSVAVMVCGPEPLVAAAQQAATNCGFYFHKETFAF